MFRWYSLEFARAKKAAARREEIPAEAYIDRQASSVVVSVHIPVYIAGFLSCKAIHRIEDFVSCFFLSPLIGLNKATILFSLAAVPWLWLNPSSFNY